MYFYQIKFIGKIKYYKNLGGEKRNNFFVEKSIVREIFCVFRSKVVLLSVFTIKCVLIYNMLKRYNKCIMLGT